MMRERKACLDRPILVEGKYDKIKLDSLFDGLILTCEGFSLFRRQDKQAFLRRIADEKGLIVLTDSDGGGTQIRSFLRGILPKEKVIHLYVPRIEGKEARKKKASRSGVLGVEGMESELLYRLLAPYTDGEKEAEKTDFEAVTKANLYEDGFSGKADSAERRALLCEKLSLPADLSANALLEILNLLGGMAFYREALSSLDLQDEIK